MSSKWLTIDSLPCASSECSDDPYGDETAQARFQSTRDSTPPHVCSRAGSHSPRWYCYRERAGVLKANEVRHHRATCASGSFRPKMLTSFCRCRPGRPDAAPGRPWQTPGAGRFPVHRERPNRSAMDNVPFPLASTKRVPVHLRANLRVLLRNEIVHPPPPRNRDQA